MHGWPSPRSEVVKEVHQYWSFRNEVAVSNQIVKKDRRRIMPASLQKRTLDQVHVNHMGIEQTRLLVLKSI